MTSLRFVRLAAALALTALPGALPAQDGQTPAPARAASEALQAVPSGPVVLTVTGASGDAIAFDRATLEALPVTEFTTHTIWTEGPQTFAGVALADLLEALDSDATTLRAQAVNDYAVDIPASDATADGPIIAYLQNGAAMSRREKGPLWVVYPYDHDVAYRSETIYSRSIWQLDRLHLK